ncbi:PEP/pyruvate-binding domain-containing protein [Myxococcus landrumensis]|uniref:Pyruvate phosphate dikinase AMP/ATP-binding domain-containing protein n=1 Tax=Myxococcus landrumensis TaxID=2813577 RepID=A0ABX7N8F7_9BACT|nr:PEP/pyruvate-binding domain-containing protein [Myxococcus landrumus]QSQ15029.1 hypothetical protein JY572_02785 [Myxococcus landrumus]
MSEPRDAWVRWLRSIGLEDVKRVGAKAARLGALARGGFDVPEGFALTVDVLEHFLEHHGLDASSDARAFQEAPLPPEVSAPLRAALVELGGGPVAVRSSGVEEDGAAASFAGQFETVLDVRGPEALEAAVRRCWASSLGERVRLYAKRRGREVSPRMGVFVQRMLAPDAAGVVFTANPVTGARDEVLINAVRGLAERLVSGECSPDEWTVRGDEVRCVANVERSLTVEQARALALLARQVERQFGQPQDIEWALTGCRLRLLQARPISALPGPVARGPAR